jgi:hypothetical protein
MLAFAARTVVSAPRALPQGPWTRRVGRELGRLRSCSRMRKRALESRGAWSSRCPARPPLVGWGQ